jgi:hypothetical protein
MNTKPNKCNCINTLCKTSSSSTILEYSTRRLFFLIISPSQYLIHPPGNRHLLNLSWSAYRQSHSAGYLLTCFPRSFSPQTTSRHPDSLTLIVRTQRFAGSDPIEMSFCWVDGSIHLGQGHESRRKYRSKETGEEFISRLMSETCISRRKGVSGGKDRTGWEERVTIPRNRIGDMHFGAVMSGRASREDMRRARMCRVIFFCRVDRHKFGRVCLDATLKSHSIR